MSCFRMWGGYHNPEKGSVSIGKETADSRFIRLPCGRCFGCRMEHALKWSVRCRHEASCWTHNLFLTLTYRDGELPWHGSLEREHLQLFLKRFRRAKAGVQVAPDGRRPVRFFGCGEYGSRTKRAHFHLLLFNTLLEDRKRVGEKTYSSRLVSELWPYGSHVIGSVTAQSAAYVAGYAQKKVAGFLERQRAYRVVNGETGEYFDRLPEFAAMSLKPGIGQFWYDRFKSDLHSGFLVVDGAKLPVPRFYEDKYKRDFPERVGEREFLRGRRALELRPDGPDEMQLFRDEAVARARKIFFRRFSQTEV